MTWMYPRPPSLESLSFSIMGRIDDSEGDSLGNDGTAGFWRISNALRPAQRTAIKNEKAPDKRKRLRPFTVSEISDLLGVKRSEILAACGQSSKGLFQPRTLLSFSDVQSIR